MDNWLKLSEGIQKPFFSGACEYRVLNSVFESMGCKPSNNNTYRVFDLKGMTRDEREIEIASMVNVTLKMGDVYEYRIKPLESIKVTKDLYNILMCHYQVPTKAIRDTLSDYLDGRKVEVID